jgi:hypothetical protein
MGQKAAGSGQRAEGSPKQTAVLIMTRTELVELTQTVNVGRDKAIGRSRRSLCRKRFAYSGLHLGVQQVKMRIAAKQKAVERCKDIGT